MYHIKILYKKCKEIVDYLFWGVMTTVVSWGTYSAFTLCLKGLTEDMHIFGLEMSMVVILSNVLSWICAVVFAYITNKLWVFHSKSVALSVVVPEFGKFVSARLVTGAMEVAGVPLLVGAGLNQTIFGIEGIVAKMVVSVLVVIMNYVFSKRFIFKKR